MYLLQPAIDATDSSTEQVLISETVCLFTLLSSILLFEACFNLVVSCVLSFPRHMALLTMCGWHKWLVPQLWIFCQLSTAKTSARGLSLHWNQEMSVSKPDAQVFLSTGTSLNFHYSRSLVQLSSLEGARPLFLIKTGNWACTGS